MNFKVCYWPTKGVWGRRSIELTVWFLFNHSGSSFHINQTCFQSDCQSIPLSPNVLIIFMDLIFRHNHRWRVSGSVVRGFHLAFWCGSVSFTKRRLPSRTGSAYNWVWSSWHEHLQVWGQFSVINGGLNTWGLVHEWGKEGMANGDRRTGAASSSVLLMLYWSVQQPQH